MFQTHVGSRHVDHCEAENFNILAGDSTMEYNNLWMEQLRHETPLGDP